MGPNRECPVEKALRERAEQKGGVTMHSSRAVSHDILSFSARVLNTTASVGALTSFEG